MLFTGIGGCFLRVPDCRPARGRSRHVCSRTQSGSVAQRDLRPAGGGDSLFAHRRWLPGNGGHGAGERGAKVANRNDCLVALARKFHTRLAGEATERSKNCHAVEGRRDFRAYVKTARRFCFSPHELERGDGVMKHQRSKGVQNHSECEKCGLNSYPVAHAPAFCFSGFNTPMPGKLR